MNHNAATDLQEVLRHEIPLTTALGLEVDSWDNDSLCLRAPLLPNINHKSTAFGGSLYAIAVLTGWGLIYLQLKQAGLTGHIVIHESQVNYTLPVKTDILACCRIQDAREFEQALRMFRRKGRARIRLTVDVLQLGELAFRLHGSYVVHQ